MTLMECYPDSVMAEEYRTIARQMYNICGGILPGNAESNLGKNKGNAELQTEYDKKDTELQEEN